MSEDSRITKARHVIATHPTSSLLEVLEGVVAFADERLRVNVGLVAQRDEFRKQIREHHCGGDA